MQAQRRRVLPDMLIGERSVKANLDALLRNEPSDGVASIIILVTQSVGLDVTMLLGGRKKHNAAIVENELQAPARSRQQFATDHMHDTRSALNPGSATACPSPDKRLQRMV